MTTRISLFVFILINSFSFGFELSDLKTGGYVIFFRHTARQGFPDPETIKLDKDATCAVGAELTAQGIQDATAIGETIRRLNIPISHVYASPTCRTKQMGKLAFLSEPETLRELLYSAMIQDPDEIRLMNRLVKVLLSEAPKPKTNRVLLSHEPVLGSGNLGVTVSLQQGDAAIFRPEGESFTHLTTLPRAVWVQSSLLED